MTNPPGQTATQTIRVAIYCRISLDRMGDKVKVHDQEKICRRLCRERGWTVVEVFTDNSKSAWQRNRKRPGWDALLADVEENRFDAIVVYHGDRLIRQPWDLELLLRLADERGLLLASPVGTRDLSNSDDRFVLRIEAAQACRESDNTSRRIKRSHERRAEAGISPCSRRPFGFENDGMTHHEQEAAIIRECADRVLMGEPRSRIARDLNERGIRTTAGGLWTYSTLGRMLARPRNAGFLGSAGAARGRGKWEPILDRDTWELVVRSLEKGTEEFGYRSNAPSHLLSGLAFCVTCGTPLQAGGTTNRKNGKIQQYVCINPGCSRKMHIVMHCLDEYVIGAALKRLSDPRLAAAVRDTGHSDAGKRLAALEKRREQVAEAFAEDPDMPPELLKKTLRRIREQIEEIKAEIQMTRGNHVLTDHLALDREGWDRLSLDRRRAIVRALFEITVHPPRKKGRKFDDKRVQLERRNVEQPLAA